jgi:NAD(P)-dependent dehydrogenase (short-subunit alcohol dehydrogenase family)
LGSFDGKVVLVTGGNSGIGKVTACAFAREGASVVIAARRKETGLEVVRDIVEAGGKATYIQCDITQGADVEKLIHRTIETYGKLDIAFNNAGIAGDRIALADMSEAQFDQIINLNVKGTWWCMKYEIPAMLQSGGGCIVNCSSTAAFKTTRGISVYTATKAALVGMTKGAAVDYAKKGIRINAVCPSLVETSMSSEYQHLAAKAHPMGRLCQPEEVADAVLWLSSDKASFITGETLAIDGGFLSV